MLSNNNTAMIVMAKHQINVLFRELYKYSLIGDRRRQYVTVAYSPQSHSLKV